MLAAESAVLLCFELIRMLLLVLHCRIVSMLAYRTFKIDYFAHLSFDLCRSAALLKKFKLKTRIELVTPSLPRTCSTN